MYQDLSSEEYKRILETEKEELYQQDHTRRGGYPSSSSSSRGSQSINPLYIAVPVAGACVLLAIIIFAIFVLRRQNQYIDEYRYHSNLRRAPHHLHHHPTNCCHDLHHQGGAKVCLYAESDRSSSTSSSSGSETKLLAKV